ncbi:hypothetical protein EJ05DRAFT_475578 [Pseudovirgaria hyperparasitica]|uniref:Uncharacterized protein n=1 Tax=Pseudovirgaria hyperparasitica TaxID=470096 RepID=A0A6A6W9W3_9PEZI|nr:uncharacterized protein EJ05DRAFT_475578 [Pseudovirgaria hyperparasitica]KAF2759355.1 hypothetical protein EJ05DRAFT_475578 [Pseudovirgaria hyperparasitica]
MEEKLPRLRRSTGVLCRAVAVAVSIGALILYLIILNKYNKREDTAVSTAPGRDLYKYLPIGGLSLSLILNGFSLISLEVRAAQWISKRTRNAVDVFAAIEVAALGYVSFVYSLVTEWHGGIIGGEEKILQVVALTLLSLTGAAHLLFFCYDCAAHFFPPTLRRDEPESWLGQMRSYSSVAEKAKSQSQVSELSIDSSYHRAFDLRRSSSIQSSRSIDIEMVVKPLSVHRKSGRTGSLYKKSNSFVRPVRVPGSVEVPDYVPNGFVTVLGNNDSKDDETQPLSHTSTALGTPATGLPAEIPVHAHTRSFSCTSHSPVPIVRLSRSRSTSSPTSLSCQFPKSPLIAIPPANSSSLKRMATPPIAEHPAFQHDRDADIPDPERKPSPGFITTRWGVNTYQDRGTFVPSLQEQGNPFGDYPLAVSGSRAKKFIMP